MASYTVSLIAVIMVLCLLCGQSSASLSPSRAHVLNDGAEAIVPGTGGAVNARIKETQEECDKSTETEKLMFVLVGRDVSITGYENLRRAIRDASNNLIHDADFCVYLANSTTNGHRSMTATVVFDESMNAKTLKQGLASITEAIERDSFHDRILFQEEEEEPVEGWTIALIAIGLIAGIAAAVFVVFTYTRVKKKKEVQASAVVPHSV